MLREIKEIQRDINNLKAEYKKLNKRIEEGYKKNKKYDLSLLKQSDQLSDQMMSLRHELTICRICYK